MRLKMVAWDPFDPSRQIFKTAHLLPESLFFHNLFRYKPLIHSRGEFAAVSGPSARSLPAFSCGSAFRLSNTVTKTGAV